MGSSTTIMAVLDFAGSIRRFQVYIDTCTCTPIILETLDTLREKDSPKDKYAIAVIKNSSVVGHSP